MNRSNKVIALTIALLAHSSHACVQMGANFWNVGWQGMSSYGSCSNGVGSWSSTFLSQIQTYSCLRFMDWNTVNVNNATTWNARSTGCGQLTGGANNAVSYEIQMDVVNRVPGCAYWLNVPGGATQDYVTNLAKLVHRTLGANRKVYLEYANETWNNNPSSPLCLTAARSCGITIDGSGIAHIGANSGVWIQEIYLGHAVVASQMWAWFRTAWIADGGDASLLVNVLAGLSAYGGAEECHGMLEAVLDSRVNPAGLKCDMFAIAPYWHAGPVGNETQLADHKKWCQQYGVKLCAYEGGPGEAGGAATNAEMTQFLTMADKYFDGPYNHYCHSGGQWGAVDNGYYQSFVDWTRNHSCGVTRACSEVTRRQSVAQIPGVGESWEAYALNGAVIGRISRDTRKALVAGHKVPSGIILSKGDGSAVRALMVP